MVLRSGGTTNRGMRGDSEDASALELYGGAQHPTANGSVLKRHLWGNTTMTTVFRRTSGSG
eukprot:3716976-Amphidinium_carterae.2